MEDLTKSIYRAQIEKIQNQGEPLHKIGTRISNRRQGLQVIGKNRRFNDLPSKTGNETFLGCFAITDGHPEIGMGEEIGVHLESGALLQYVRGQCDARQVHSYAQL